MQDEHADELRFHPTGGRGTGVLAVFVALVVVVLTVADPRGTPAWAAPLAVLIGVLGWASSLWPRLSVDAEDLVLRNMVETVRVPFTAIEALAVRQVLAIRAGGKRYVSTAAGRSLRKTVRNKPGTRPAPDVSAPGIDYVDYIEHEIRHRMELAREAADTAGLPDDQVPARARVRREPEWLPIGLIGASTLALLVSLLF